MEGFDTILNSICEFGTDIFLSFFGYGFIGSLVGLFGMIHVIRRLNKSGKFNRPNRLWSFIASINKFYLPVVFMVFFGFLFGTYGVNSKINDHVEKTIYSTVDQMNLNSYDFSGMNQHMNPQLTLEELLISELGGISPKASKHETNIIAQAMLQELGFPSEIDGFVKEVRSIDWTVLEKGSKIGLSYIATDYIDGVFWFVYRFIVVFFTISFLKLSILEFVIFMIYSKLTGFGSKTSFNHSNRSNQNTIANTELV